MRPAPTRWAAPSSRPRRSQKEITYDGSTYRQRSGLETYLIMGIDVKGKAVGVDSYEGGGQADVQMVLVVDDANKTWQVLQINPRHHHEGAGTGCSGRGGGVCRRADRAGPLLRQWPGEQLREHRARRLDAAGRPAHRRIFCIEHGRRGHRHRPCGGRDPDRHLGFLRDRPHAGAGRRGDAGRREGADLCAQPPPHRRPDQHRPHGPSAAVPRPRWKKSSGSRTASSQPKPIRRWRTTW